MAAELTEEVEEVEEPTAAVGVEPELKVEGEPS